MKYQAIRGMQDIIPPEVNAYQELESRSRDFLKSFSYNEIRTPIVEYTDLFTRAIGEGTDIVNKEMYSFQDRKGRSLSLRPEMTASVVRAVIENNLLSPEETSRFFYIGPMFRAERPQAGRRRQFHQIGVELFGKQSPYQDAEVMILFHDYLLCLGLKPSDFTLKLNTLGTAQERGDYLDALREYLVNAKDQLSADDQRRLEQNVLRVLDSKDPATRKICANAPRLSGFLRQESRDYHAKVLDLLDKNQVAFEQDDFLVRGLDYYQNTVFEVTSNLLGAQDAVGAGGRYDGLLRDCGGPDLGGIGFAIGIERLLLVLEKSQWQANHTQQQELVFFIHSGEAAKDKCLELAFQLGRKKIRVMADFVKGSIKSQMRAANRAQASWTIILGDEELALGEAMVKDMKTGEQVKVKQGDLEAHILRKLK